MAIRAARSAGRIAARHFDERHRLEVHEKAPMDLVTSADIAVERELIEQLMRAYPDYAILAEESGRHDNRKAKGWQWIIDPIDGTANFAHGMPHFGISVALAKDGEVQAGLVFDPLRDELFVAEKGRGAFLNDRRIRVSDETRLAHALLATGFPFRKPKLKEPYLKAFAAMLQQTGELRRAGSASLDLAYVAAGRYDGYFEMRLSPWDIAAGVLLVTEAGGFVTDLNGGNAYLTSGDVVAGSPAMQPQVLDALRAVDLHRVIG
ncbi:putative inositol-phosphate phosphatase [Magnetofaba australis IT-1]|uniref:Inositol-1-monophosphatase n=1 Tax=Magnetofaba australis IT-1 TaxID=1434232 RepID=A0A1Y2K9H3_9PROT|nr:putative inositol-phosphate phosphatase [Magnetofaba australis IT-1]